MFARMQVSICASENISFRQLLACSNLSGRVGRIAFFLDPFFLCFLSASQGCVHMCASQPFRRMVTTSGNNVESTLQCLYVALRLPAFRFVLVFACACAMVGNERNRIRMSGWRCDSRPKQRGDSEPDCSREEKTGV